MNARAASANPRLRRFALIVLPSVFVALVTSPLYAERLRPAPNGQPSVARQDDSGPPDVCPLSETQQQNAIAAWNVFAQTPMNQERCSNCHWGIDPFRDNGGHLAGTMKRVDTPDGSFDADASYQQCQGCHGGLPGWRMPPTDFTFGQNPVLICRMQRERFKTSDEFVGHVDHDSTGIPFIDTAFAGTRGLNETGRDAYEALSGQPYQDEPIEGIDHPTLVTQARDWVDAMGGKFRGGNEKSCGCEPLGYTFRFEDHTELVVPPPASGSVKASSIVDIPITFQDDGSFSGLGQAPRFLEETISAAGVTCKLDAPPQLVTVEARGNLDEDNKVMHVKMSWRIAAAQAAIRCESPRGTYSVPFNLPANDSSSVSSPLDSFDLPAFLNQERDFTIPLPNGKIDAHVELHRG